MIYEFRTYTSPPGQAPRYLNLVRDVGKPVRGDNFGRNHGYWSTELGPLNQVWHLWSFASLDERRRSRTGFCISGPTRISTRARRRAAPR